MAFFAVGLDVARGPHRAPTPMMGGVPSIEVLAERQRMATLLSDNWDRAAGMIGGLSGDLARADKSEVHGIGLIAEQDIEAGTLVTLYPVHRILQSLDDGRGAAVLADAADELYFRPSEGVSADEMAYRQVAYRQTYSHPNPERPESFQLDANPLKLDVTGWLGHRINDGATLSPSCSSEDEILAYYEESGKRRNVCPLALCVPLLGFVTTRAVAEGDELLATYGHGYWLQEDMPCSDAVEKALLKPAQEVIMWQIASDKKYAEQVAALDQFISQTTSKDLQEFAEGAPTAATPAEGASHAAVTGAAPTTPVRSTGFGKTSATKSAGKKKRKR